MKILITGGSKGIGLSLVKKLVNNGNDIIVINRKATDEQKKLPIEVWEYDLSDEKDIEKVAKRIRNHDIDVLVNNAGGGVPCDLSEITIEQVNSEMNLNVTAPLILIQAALTSMKRNNFGRIVNISSTAGRKGVPYLFSYSAAKASIISITQSISRYLNKNNITVNAICPGGIDTSMGIEGRRIISEYLKFDKDDYQKKMIDSMKIGRLIKPEEVANIILFLIDAKNSVITGQTINVCGAAEIT